MEANYIYQTIHTLGHNPLHVAAHCRLLERAFMDVYFRPLVLDEELISSSIIELLESKCAPKEVSVFVELRLSIDFKWEVSISEISIYDGYSVRSISPSAECITFDSPFGLYPTSARREVLRFADNMAANFGGEIAIECSRSGEVISAGGGAIFGIAGRKIITPHRFQSVEKELVINASRELKLEVSEIDFTKKELAKFDELFIADHYGATSISRCGERYYIPVLADKIITQLAQPF